MPKKLLHLYVFITGATVLALEIAASRLMAPYFGTSLFVWGNILGIVLAALAIGYYFGGQLADKSPHMETLGLITWVAGVIVALIPLLSPLILKSITSLLTGLPFFVLISSFLGMLLLFAIPLILLGALTPLATRIAVHDVSEVGRVSGSLSAASTAGSILGAFIPSFFLIPFWGTRFTIIISSIILISIGTLALKKKSFILGLVLPILLLIVPQTTHASAKQLFSKETSYQYIRVFTQEEKRYLIVNEGAGVQTISMDENGLTGGYTDSAALLPSFFPDDKPLDILIIGVAGGSVIRQMRHHFPNRTLKIDAVDIDSEMFEVAESFFDLKTEDAQQITMDGRQYLQSSEKLYDIIFVDAYQEELYVPFHLATNEFFSLAAQRLAPKGILSMNTLGDVGDALPEYLAETVRSVFPYTSSTHFPGTLNNLVIASFSSPDWDALGNAPDILQEHVKEISEHENLKLGTQILTDDRAPVEYLTDKMLLKFALKHLN